MVLHEAVHLRPRPFDGHVKDFLEDLLLPAEHLRSLGLIHLQAVFAFPVAVARRGVKFLALYRRFLQPVDRELAAHFPCAFMHLHSTSMFLLDTFLEIEEIRCFQVNYEVRSGGPPVAGMIPHWRKIQAAGRPLLLRGSLTPDEMRLLMDSLDPRGLYLYVMIENMAEVEALRPVVGM